ncbi:hypothetical protein GCM10023079_43240 [Streptomyces chitinivorans]
MSASAPAVTAAGTGGGVCEALMMIPTVSSTEAVPYARPYPGQPRSGPAEAVPASGAAAVTARSSRPSRRTGADRSGSATIRRGRLHVLPRSLE